MARSRKLAVSSVDPVHLNRRIVRTPRAVANGASSGVQVQSLGDAYIGIDPSLTGYGIVALFADGQHLDKLVTTKADQDVYAYRLKHIQETVTEALRAVAEHYTVKAICVERPAYNASGAFTGGLVHAVTALALLDVFDGTTLVKPDLIATTTLKKFVTGNGAAKGKGLMTKHVYKKWGYDTDDDNLADAYGLARLAAAVTFGTSELSYERDCIATVLKRRTPWEPPQQQKPSRPRSPRSTQPRHSKARATASKSGPQTRSSSA